MNLGNLEFKEEDFANQDGKTILLDPNAKDNEFNDSFVCSLRVGRILAAYCNRLLKEKLDKAPTVEGYIHSDGYILMDAPGNMSLANDYPSVRHEAKLVCVKEIK